MALLNPYATVAQVQEELQNSDAGLTSVIEDAINAASRWIDDYKGVDYFEHDHTETPLKIHTYYRDLSGSRLMLPFSAVSELDSVREGTTELVADTDYVRDGVTLHRIGANWTVGAPPEHISVYGVFGYPQTAATAVPTGLPPHINRAAVMLAAVFTGHLSKEVVGIDGTKSTVVTKDIPKAVREILGPGRLLS